MLLLFGVLSAMVAGYVAWCSRTFYLRAPLPDLSLWSEEFRSVASSEIEAEGLRNPEKFRFKRFVELLTKPYDSAPSRILTIPTKGGGVLICRRHARYPVVFLVKSETGWKRWGND